MNFLRSCYASLALLALPWIASAQSGLGDANDINSGGGGGDLKTTILNIAQQILKFVSLVAVVVIIIAGIWLIVGLGDESAKEKAKKIVMYTIVGLILILISQAIVTFVIHTVG
ncbi:MAG: TrbC/VirB2 family protein [Candidatus Peribacteraceae bacterium]|nr:TrbC/VirB2 family protein [Candidatus Peribacteraceae bacterium]MDD5742951.1 TrbC/VirB2 family protein [Candidatus Peribacteraceae bacterium]